MEKSTIQSEIDKNYTAFKKMNFSAQDKGKFALMKDGKVIEIMSSKEDCHKLAKNILDNNIYSIQEILPDKRDLGFMSYALR